MRPIPCHMADLALFPRSGHVLESVLVLPRRACLPREGIMDFDLDEDAQELRKLAADATRPGGGHRRGSRPTSERRPVRRRLWTALAQAGLLGACLPEEAGGAGLGAVELACCSCASRRARRAGPRVRRAGARRSARRPARHPRPARGARAAGRRARLVHHRRATRAGHRRAGHDRPARRRHVCARRGEDLRAVRRAGVPHPRPGPYRGRGVGRLPGRTRPRSRCSPAARRDRRARCPGSAWTAYGPARTRCSAGRPTAPPI